jgi:hypothetical protein
MRFSRLAAAAFCGMAMVGGSAQAALSFSAQRSSVDANYDRVVLYALSDTSTGQAANVLAQKTTTTTSAPNGLQFLVDPRFGVFVTSTNGFPVATTTSTVVDFRLADLIGFEDPDHTDPSKTSQFQAGLTTWTIHSAAKNSGAGYLADSSVNGGKGFAVLGAVVPKGADVRFIGSVSDATTATSSNYPIIAAPGASESEGVFNTVTPVPEPVGLALIGLGAIGLIGRRNRRV